MDEFDIEVGTIADGDLDDQASKEHRAGVRLLVIDPDHIDSAVMRKLESAGFACSLVETGAQALQAIAAGQFAAMVCVATADDDWRRFLAANVKARLPEFPILFSAKSAAESEHDRLLALGATAVLPAQLPKAAELGELVDGILGIEPVLTTSATSGTEMVLLQRRLHEAEEAGRLKDQEIAQLRNQFLEAIGEAAERSKESTGLRSEVSILRDRAGIMQERLGRAKQYIDWLKKENARLASDRGQEPATAPTPDTNAARLQQLQSLLAALMPFEQSLAQALDFFQDLSSVAGPKAQALTRHVNQLRLLRDAFQRIRARMGEMLRSSSSDSDQQ
jgi:CheY-like chemotaxis protein